MDELFKNLSEGRVEPHADIRNAAVSMFQMYTAYTDAGFAPVQAMQLLVAIITPQKPSAES